MWWRQRGGGALFVVQVDAAMASDGSGTGLGVLLRDGRGQPVRWEHRRGPWMTNNEAEYAALCLALELLVAARAAAAHIFSDSEIVVGQMRGRFRVQSADLRAWHQRACGLARQIPTVTYTHIPRERNRLADALANEALQPALPLPDAVK